MCWFSMAKLLMFVFNTALFLAGVATLGVGIWISTTTDQVELVGITISQNGAIVLIAAGAVTLGMGFLGCCGAKNENSGCLGLYFFLLLIIVILQIAVGIWAAVTYDSLNEVVGDSLKLLELDDPDDIKTLNSLSEQFYCCGRTSICDDLSEASPDPLICTCDNIGPNCGPLCDSNLIYNQTCTDAITHSMEENMKIIAGIGIGIGIIEILGLLFSWCMCQAIKEKQGYA